MAGNPAGRKENRAPYNKGAVPPDGQVFYDVARRLDALPGSRAAPAKGLTNNIFYF